MTDFPALRRRMVDNQIRPSDVTDREIIRAFLEVPREPFVEAAERPFAYADRELRMSAAAPDRRMLTPVQLARLVQALSLAPASKAMAVACGTGFSAAILARLTGSVVALEENEALAALARERLGSVGANNVEVVCAKLTGGHPAGAPYDGILLEGSVEFVPDALLEQLRRGGMLAVVERDERISRAMLYERTGQRAARRPLFDAWATLLPGFERKREFVF